MECCQGRSRIKGAGEIAVARAVALKFARRRGFDEDLADIQRIKAITFAVCD
jgi:hypothetical protein